MFLWVITEHTFKSRIIVGSSDVWGKGQGVNIAFLN